MKEEKKLIRSAMGAGKWFPASRIELQAMIRDFMEEAHPPPVEGCITGIIAPHAGYIYSGPVAATAYKSVRDNIASHSTPDASIVLGFGHRGSFRGIALMDGNTFATPLGLTPLDCESAAFLTASDPRITVDYRPHIGEHSAENQIPFLQTILPETPMVIGLIGSHDPTLIEVLASSLVKLSKKKKILVIASSDMLHDPSYDLVRKTDIATLKKVTSMDISGVLRAWDFTQQVFCGIAPVVTTMQYASHLGCARAVTLRYRNSGDDFPESRGQWVVGYGAVAFPVTA